MRLQKAEAEKAIAKNLLRKCLRLLGKATAVQKARL